MNNRSALKLTFAEKAGLALAGVVALAIPVILGITSASALRAQGQAITKFEVASIRSCKPGREVSGQRGGGYAAGGGYVAPTPGRLNIECMPLIFLIKDAYVRSAHAVIRPVEIVPISGGPSWINSERYDIEAKADGNPALPRPWRVPCSKPYSKTVSI